MNALTLEDIDKKSKELDISLDQLKLEKKKVDRKRK